MEEKIIQSQKYSFSKRWEMLVDNIVRPPRKTYNPEILLRKKLQMNNRVFNREHFEIVFKEKKLWVSVYTQSKDYNQISQDRILVLYLHSNSSNQFQCLTLIPSLPKGWALAGFDFIGCGNDYNQNTISLGIRQSEQTNCIVNFFKNRGYKVVLWGRSMGAVTALICANAQVIVADSAFISIKQASKDVAFKYLTPFYRIFFCCFFQCVFAKLKYDVKIKANYNMDDLDMQKWLKKIKPQTLVIFMSAKNDQIIDIRHTLTLHNQFKGEKHLETFQGGHNSLRPQEVYNRIFSLIRHKLDRGRISIQKNDSCRSLSLEMEISSRRFSK